MKGDFTRRTFAPGDRYTAVTLQQGRVQLDADWNEQIDIAQHLDREARGDEVGPSGAPHQHAGFEVTISGTHLVVGAGRYYVDGLLCDNPLKVSLSNQPHFPGYTPPSKSGTYAVFLETFERHVTALEDPRLREVALGGPDTATRKQLVWQVRLVKLGPSTLGRTCVTAKARKSFQEWTAGSTGTLEVRTNDTAPNPDPCTVPAVAGYRGRENHLYRVEIHEGSFAVVDGEVTDAPAAGVTFKWSRDNGSIVTEWLEDTTLAADRMRVRSLGRDDVLRIGPDQWVEVADVDRELRRQPGTMVKVGDTAGDDVIIADASTPVPAIAGFAPLRTVRRWDDPDGVRPADQGSWLELEHGVEVRFGDGRYQTGDYWLVPARTATGAVEFPAGAQRPHGPRRHHALLAIVQRSPTGWQPPSDCRKKFPATVDLVRLDYLGGDGQEAMPEARLPRTLRVGVSNGRFPVPGRRVRFALGASAGELEDMGGATGATLEVTTGPDGIAEVWWTMPAYPLPAGAQLTATATLLGADDAPYTDADAAQHHAIVFSANQSVTSDVFYDNTQCDHMAAQGATTVQEAIDASCHNHTLYYVSGDGQSGLPAERLPVPLGVRVGNRAWSVPGARVRFELDDHAHGTLNPAIGTVHSVTTIGPRIHTLVMETEAAAGRAAVWWTLGDQLTTPDQTVHATLLNADGSDAHPLIRFNGTIARARDVAYAGRCKHLDGANTVREALETLCANATIHHAGGDGQAGRPGQVLSVKPRVRVANGAWPREGALVRFEVLNAHAYGRHLDVTETGMIKSEAMRGWGRGRAGVPAGWYDKLVVRTDAEGMASCQWWLGTESRLATQRLRATLLDEHRRDTGQSVLFTAEVERSDPLVRLVGPKGPEGVLRPGAVVPINHFYGLMFEELLVDKPDAAHLMQWWPGVQVVWEMPLVYGRMHSPVILPGQCSFGPRDALVWRLILTSVGVVVTDSAPLSTLLAGKPPVMSAAPNADRIHAAGLKDGLLRPKRPAGRRLFDRELRRRPIRQPVPEIPSVARPPRDSPPGRPTPRPDTAATREAAPPFADPRGWRPGEATEVVGDPRWSDPEPSSARALVRIHLRPWMFPGRSARGAPDFESYFWLDYRAED